MADRHFSRHGIGAHEVHEYVLNLERIDIRREILEQGGEAYCHRCRCLFRIVEVVPLIRKLVSETEWPVGTDGGFQGLNDLLTIVNAVECRVFQRNQYIGDGAIVQLIGSLLKDASRIAGHAQSDVLRSSLDDNGLEYIAADDDTGRAGGRKSCVNASFLDSSEGDSPAYVLCTFLATAQPLSMSSTQMAECSIGLYTHFISLNPCFFACRSMTSGEKPMLKPSLLEQYALHWLSLSFSAENEPTKTVASVPSVKVLSKRLQLSRGKGQFFYLVDVFGKLFFDDGQTSVRIPPYR